MTPAPAKQRFVLFATWSDVPPEFIGVFDGTEAEARAWCAGYSHAKLQRYSPDGEAATLEDILADMKGYGLTESDSELIAYPKNGGAMN